MGCSGSLEAARLEALEISGWLRVALTKSSEPPRRGCPNTTFGVCFSRTIGGCRRYPSKGYDPACIEKLVQGCFTELLLRNLN